MTTDELEEKLEGGTETPAIEFKGACYWSVATFVKDILALSNVLDGGYIIVGVEDGSFKREGVNAAQRESYKVDEMRDQVAPYADPHANFTVYFPRNLQGEEYVVIRVFQFEEVPVICRKDSAGTKAGTFYYRNKNRRVESAPISNSYDMRDVITLATIKMLQRNTELGFTVEPSAKKKLDEELEGL